MLIWPFFSNAGALCREDVEAAAWQRPQLHLGWRLTEADKTKKGKSPSNTWLKVQIAFPSECWLSWKADLPNDKWKWLKFRRICSWTPSSLSLLLRRGVWVSCYLLTWSQGSGLCGEKSREHSPVGPLYRGSKWGGLLCEEMQSCGQQTAAVHMSTVPFRSLKVNNVVATLVTPWFCYQIIIILNSSCTCFHEDLENFNPYREGGSTRSLTPFTTNYHTKL